MSRLLGIDVGGTKTAVGIFGEAGLERHEILPTGSFDQTSAAIEAVVAGDRFDAAGVSSPGPLDKATGTILNDDTLKGWYGRPLVAELGDRFQAPIVVLNDADAALLGELFWGSLKDDPSRSAVMLTFGTGVGGAIWNGSAIVEGAYGEHPEIGHLIVRPSGPTCYCGASGCLESVASGSALELLSKELGGVKKLAGLARAGVPAALEILDRTRDSIGEALWTLTHVVRPAAFILGGGVMDSLFERLVPALEFRPSTVPGPPPIVTRAELGGLAGMYGAARAAEELLP